MKIPSQPNLNALWSFLLIEELLRNHIDYFCISPGSRSGPFATAVANHTDARSTIIYDERSAAFHALGYGRATGKPAVLICTSGTAVANYFPAVIEASMEYIPMIILSADRPYELRQTGANQTIDQVKIFGDYLRDFKELPPPDVHIPARVVLTSIDHSIACSINDWPGVVHINCMFREPLAPKKEPFPDNYTKELQSWYRDNKPYSNYSSGRFEISQAQIQSIAQRVTETGRGIVVLGRLQSNECANAIYELVKRLDWPVFPDITSGFRLGHPTAPFIPYFDFALLRQNQGADLILHLGGQINSKRLLQWIDAYPPVDYIVVNPYAHRYDPVHRVTCKVQCSLPDFCERLTYYLEKRSYAKPSGSLNVENNIEETLPDIVKVGEKLNEPAVAYRLSLELPDNSGLYLASSLPVREMLWYASARGNPVPVASNRGASGIDGTVASAAGFATGLKIPVTLLIGDLALYHDLNSLHLLKHISQPVIVILLNNHGGGIFHFLPIAEYEDIFEQYYGTPHNLTFQPAADQFGLPYYRPSDMEQLLNVYRMAASEQRSVLIEIETDRRHTAELHRRVEAIIKKGNNRTEG